jgi:hypothetical protein
MSPPRTGLLIIRARCEETSSRPLRAHIRLTTDISSGFEASMTLTQVAAVGKTVEGWLEDILAASGHASVAGYLAASMDADTATPGSGPRRGRLHGRVPGARPRGAAG